MNERIRELAAQAGFEFWQDESWNPGDIIDWSARYDDEFIRFSELLVRECMRLCIHELADPRDSTEMKCTLRIKQHFGVVE